MIRRKPLKFDECFPPEKTKTSNEFKSYMSIVNALSSKTPDKLHPEKHHIVPREWLSWKFEDFSFDNEDPSNVVYLSVKDKLLALLHLILFFLDVGDSVTYRNLTSSVSRRYHLGKFDFWKNPYLDRETIKFLVGKRTQELEMRKMKYSDEFLEKCRNILESSYDLNEGFKNVVEQTGFKFTKRALFEQLRKRGFIK